MNISSKNVASVLMAVFAICTTNQKQAVAAVETNGHQEQTLIVFDCDSHYVKINAISGTVQATGTYPTFPDASARFDGCLINDVRDTNTGVLYALMPQSHLEDGEKQSYAVVGLNEKDLKVLMRYDLPTKQSVHPNLIYDPIQQDLLIVFNDGLAFQRLGIASGSNLNPGLIVKLKQPLVDPHVDSEGNILGVKTVFDSTGHIVQQVRPESIFDAALKEKFSRETLVKDSTEHYYGAAIEEAAAAGRLIFTLAGDSESEHSRSAGVIVYDTRLKRAVSSFFSPFPVELVFAGHGTLHVSPDGHRIVLEQYEWLPADVKPMPSDDPNRRYVARTGALAVYNADTGSLVGNVTVEKSAYHQQSQTLINFSSDSQYMFYWFDNHLYVIDAEKGQLVSKLTLPNKFDPDAVVARPLGNQRK